MNEQATTTPRQGQIIDAAVGVFLRYGYARTTMADIARAAGITRPTLYATFPDKERVFMAVVEKMIDDKLTEISDGLSLHPDFEGKLRYACDAWAVGGYELVQAHPDAADMFDLGFKSVCAGYERFTALLAEILDVPLKQSNFALSSMDIARTIVSAMVGFKKIASSAIELRGLIEAQTKLVASAIAPNMCR
jgi:AcrR family transcriptional regulator